MVAILGDLPSNHIQTVSFNGSNMWHAPALYVWFGGGKGAAACSQGVRKTINWWNDGIN